MGSQNLRTFECRCPYLERYERIGYVSYLSTMKKSLRETCGLWTQDVLSNKGAL